MNVLMEEAQARARAMLKPLDSWENASAEEVTEQRETFTALKLALDEDRPYPQRKMFPEHEVEEHRQLIEGLV